MTDGDVRALIVKTLSEPQLTHLHLMEQQRGFPMIPVEVVGRLHTTPLRKHYGIPERGGRAQAKALREWGHRVRAVMDRFARESGARFTTDPMESLHAFDQAVWSSDLDFYYRTATVTKRATGWRTFQEAT